MSRSSRSYEERTSSYKKQFGDGPSRFTYRTKSPARKVASRTFRFSSSSTGGAGPSRVERVSVKRVAPVSSGITMNDITMMADSLGPGFQDQRVHEKEELQELNSRFAGYIQKVRALEQANRVLEAQVEQLSNEVPSRMGDMYEEELARLRREVDTLTNQKNNLELQLENATMEAAKLKQRLDEESALRRDLENDLNDMRKDCDDATLVRLDLERRLETLQEEIEFLKRMHEQEVAELQEKIRNTEIRIETAPGPDLEELLNDMRIQYEKMAAKNRAEAEEWYTEKVDNLQQQAARNDDALRNVRNEITEYRKSVQTLNLEIDSLRGTNDSLQRSLAELEERYEKDTGDLQDTINNLQVECEDLKAQMAQHLRQYQELMDVKMALDIEIATYRKLLEGEESRISDRVSQIQSSSLKSGYIPVRRGYQRESSSSRSKSGDDVETVTTKKVVVKTIETKDGKVVSQSEDVRESTGDATR